MSDASELPKKEEEEEEVTPEPDEQSDDSSEEEAAGDTEMDFLRNLFSSTLGLGSAEKVLDDLTLEGIAQYIKSGKCKNIICMVGAGISTSAGIPDFRSPGTGLYANLQKYNLPYPEAIFQIDYFKKHPEPFFALAKELYPGQFKPTVCHYFMKILKEKGLLSRCYTQNIDTLERVAGLEGEDLIEAHGTFYTSHCVSFCCRKEYSLDWMKDKIFSDDIPQCDKCSSLVKPDIVFFGENLPVRFFTSMKMDFPRCDLLIVMGTSLQVQPFAGLVGRVSKSCPRLLINMEKAGQADPLLGLLGFGGGMDFDSDKAYRDVAHISTCDDGCLALADLLGWKAELEDLVKREHARIDSKDKKEKAGAESKGAAAKGSSATVAPEPKKEEAVHSQVNGTTAIPWRSSRRRLSLLELLRSCQDAWCPGTPWNREEAHVALCGTPTGSFLVVRDATTSQASVLCVSAGGEEDDAVIDYTIKSVGTVFQLSGSRLCFADLAQLVLFYSLTRDVLAVCLSIPHWICSISEKNKYSLSKLGPETWLHKPSEQETAEMTDRAPGNVMCSIQLTSTNGALCIINPLYLREHGDDWLTNRAPSCATQPSLYRGERRLSTTRTWAGAGLQNKRAISLDQEPSSASTESSGLTRAQSADSPACPLTPLTPAPPGGVVLRRLSRDSNSSLSHRASSGSLPPSTPSTPGGSNRTSFELQPHGSPVPQSPHRVSWIEDGVWLPPPRPSSLLQPPSTELDSLSISSIEEEQESQTQCPASHHQSAHWLADKVMNRLSAVGQALSGLVSQKKRLTNRVQELSERKGSGFAEAVKGFIEVTLKRGAEPGGVMGSEFLQEVRSSLTSLREMLLDYSDIQVLLDSMTDINDSEIDSLVELSLHKVALKPVSAHLYSCIRSSRIEDGSFERLQKNLTVLEKKEMEELGGSAEVGVPDSVSLERIQQRWTSMHEAYSPNKKVQILLKVCKSIYLSMSANSSSGSVFGADDFLPCLTWVLLRSDVVTLQIDTDYMMELLDPTQLQGEGGYYLTTLYASLYYISSFQPRLAARQLSVEAQNSLNQWHRRRTLHCNQSRRSKNRRTIRRRERERGVQNSETERGSKDESVRGKSASVESEESQQQMESSTDALQPLEEEEKNKEPKTEEESQVCSSASDCNQEAMTESKQEDGLSLCSEEEKDHRGVEQRETVELI
ncbi:NAD-dependent protein deacetylase sirtuin-2 [Xyrichtys novacula]|uniref:NAD-dependent protein deacetylase sirtuin-2 n=1 Tax=Xyrichtys novacula TaxID=13765 RepID=A0AAV1FZP6_XYRNO|nr:NAD-dependent protein deacetylase sirtuin-2 [Xyrichtys novacula]